MPVLTFACGPTNSMRGAAFLSKEKNALVVDVGGTTTDVGEVKDGFPQTSRYLCYSSRCKNKFFYARCNKLWVGGGSLIDIEKPSVGPQSVGHELTQ